MNEVESDWISLSQSLSIMGESKMAAHHQDWVRMNEWSFFVQNGWMQEGRIQDGCHQQVDWEWMTLSQIELVWVRVCAKWPNPTWQNFKMACHHQVESEWMSEGMSFMCRWWEPILASVSEFRVRVEWECFWVNLREDNKVSESKMPCVRIQYCRNQDGCDHQVESEWLSLSQIELVLSANGGNQSDWQVRVFLRINTERWMNPWCLNPIWQNSRWLPSST